MSWIYKLKLAVEDPGVFYRVFYCEKCQSLRYHKVIRLQIHKDEKEWLVFFKRTCNGYPPIIYGHKERAVRDCNFITREWISASQWNALVKVNAYAA